MKEIISKEQDQLKICDVELAKKPDYILIRNLRQKIIQCFNEMGIPQKEYSKFLVTGEQIACLRGQVKSHKEIKVSL